MKLIISPAKRMRTIARDNLDTTTPAFLEQTGRILRTMQAFSPWQLEQALAINSNLALQAFEQYQDFDVLPQSPAIFSFWGLQYQHIRAVDMDDETLLFAQECLRIVSPFYGLLAPLDAMKPYRLELKSRVQVEGKNLYAFWGSRLCDSLYENDGVVLNLASHEYAAVIARHVKGRQFITCDFLTPKRGVLRMIPTSAKIARGLMARYVVQNRITNPQDVQAFEEQGFCFAKEMSTSSRYVLVQWLFGKQF